MFMKFTEFTLQLSKNDEIICEEDLKNASDTEDILEFELLDYATTLDLVGKIFIRENADFKFTLDILNKICTILLKKEDLEIPVNVEHCVLIPDFNKITLEYIIESEDAKNKIVIRKKGEQNE